MTKSFASTCALIVAISVISRCAFAQEPPRATPTVGDSATHASNTGVGFSFGATDFTKSHDGDFALLGLNWTTLRPRRIGTEFLLGSFPRTTFEVGLLSVFARLNANYAWPVWPSLTIMPTAGISALGLTDVAIHDAYRHGYLGANGGVGLVMGTPGHVGFRAAFTVHRMSGGNGGILLTEFGLMRVPGTRQRP